MEPEELKLRDIDSAYKLEPGACYLLQMKRSYSSFEFEAMRTALDALAQRTGCNFSILDKDMRLIKPQPADQQSS
jgi:hypothetical protein